MKKPRKPKLAALPKKPKASASVQSLENWKKRAADVQKRNNAKVTDYNKKVSAYYSDLKKRDTLRNSVTKKHTVKLKD